ncbi:diacylglycerol kinase family protein [Capnocytophaga stomatis]|uniref:diacylglycerol kinase family protein n=1 Tax=Capnocytophaga stomatis TaxID=1848904 RepID=UPI0018E3EA3F|nr:diacylglycerol kinase family protein [Capnocytophaga stomatis]GIM49709.1 diacylglycerol kinase [Capnocytophaga stomatis]
MITFIKGRIRSLYYVLVGVWHLVCKEPPILVHTSVTLFFFFLGFYFEISRTEWMIQVLACGIVLTVESLNTAIEKICDFIHPDYHKKIGTIKDISAGAVGFAVGAATIALAILYYPYFF